MKKRIFPVVFFLTAALFNLTIFSIAARAQIRGSEALTNQPLAATARFDAGVFKSLRPRIYRNASMSAKSKPAADGANRENTTYAPFDNAALERRVFELVNQKRLEFGLPPVVWSEDVARVARVHSRNMAASGFFSHQGVDGKRVDARADALGVRKWRALGENIAYNRGYGSPLESAVQSWMNSAGHRENILNNRWEKSGVGITVAADGAYYFTQVFLKN